MGLKAAEEYIESVKKLKPKVYLGGEKVEDILDNPVTRSVVDTTAKVYELSADPAYQDLMTTTSHLTGQRINRAVHVHRSVEDNLARVKMARFTSQKLGTCNYRCPGAEAITPLAGLTWEVDHTLGTEYNKRFNNFLKHLQENDLVCSTCAIDPKGDRSKRVLDQDPDIYIRIVEKKSDGIVIRGAKPQVTGSYAAHEHLVLFTLDCHRGEEDYAIAFAVPNETEGLTYICQYSPYTAERIMHKGDISLLGNPYGQRETAMVVFDDVFVPWERVFFCGEVDFIPDFFNRFFRLHGAHCSGGCKPGWVDLIIGASQLIIEYSGLQHLPHIREDLVEMIRLNETLYACSIAAALTGREEPEGSGVYIPSYLAQTGKIAGTTGFWEIMKLAGDIAGALVVTMPSERELENPETKGYIEKYLKAAAPAKDRLRIAKFLQHWVAGLHGVATWHGGMSPQYHREILYQGVNLEEKKSLAKALAGIE